MEFIMSTVSIHADVNYGTMGDEVQPTRSAGCLKTIEVARFALGCMLVASAAVFLVTIFRGVNSPSPQKTALIIASLAAMVVGGVAHGCLPPAPHVSRGPSV